MKYKVIFPLTRLSITFYYMLIKLIENVVDMESLAIRFGKTPKNGIIKISLNGEAPKRIKLSDNPKGFYYLDRSKKWGGSFLDFYIQASEVHLTSIEAMLEIIELLCVDLLQLKKKNVKMLDKKITAFLEKLKDNVDEGKCNNRDKC